MSGMGVLFVLILIIAAMLSSTVMMFLVGLAILTIVMSCLGVLLGISFAVLGVMLKILGTYLLAMVLKWVVRKLIDVVDTHTSLLQTMSNKQLDSVSMAVGAIIAIWYMFFH